MSAKLETMVMDWVSRKNQRQQSTKITASTVNQIIFKRQQKNFRRASRGGGSRLSFSLLLFRWTYSGSKSDVETAPQRPSGCCGFHFTCGGAVHRAGRSRSLFWYAATTFCWRKYLKIFVDASSKIKLLTENSDQKWNHRQEFQCWYLRQQLRNRHKTSTANPWPCIN